MTKKTILLLLATLNICFAFSQNTFKAILKNSTTQENLVGVTAVHKGTSKGASSNVNGEVTINNIPDDVETLTNGIYFLQVRSNNNFLTQKFIKQ